jgi:hypothetical protein
MSTFAASALPARAAPSARAKCVIAVIKGNLDDLTSSSAA